MNKYFILAFLFGSAFLGCGQMILSSGSDLIVNSGSIIVVNNIKNNGGTITNNGEVSVLGDITNNTGGLFNSSSSGTVTFEGSSGQIITGDNDIGFYGTLDINNSSGVSITDASTGVDQTINGSLNFTSGLLTINGFDLNIGSTDPTGVGTSSYIVTNGIGQVKRTVSSSDIIFPVGNSDYNPIVLNNSGTSDSYGVQDNDSKPASFSGTTHIVNGSWDITEAVSGNSNLTVTIQWNSGEEATAFNRSKSCIGITTDAGANVSWGTTGAVTGSDPYVRSHSGYTSVGTFMVGDYYYTGLELDITVQNITITNAQTECYNATSTITIAGSGTTVDIQSGGEATFIAGETIYLKPGFHSYSGSYTHAYITTTGDYCSSLPPIISLPETGSKEYLINPEFVVEDGFDINIYPNPTKGNFIIDFKGKETTADILLLNFQGATLLEKKCKDQMKIDLDISYLSEGMYIIIIKTKTELITKKIIKKY